VNEVPRELQWAEAFVALADTLLDDFDIIDFLHVLAEHCVTLLHVTAAGVMIADHEGRLRVTASSTERAGLLELFDLQNDEGPGLDCYTQGTAVSVAGSASLTSTAGGLVSQPRLAQPVFGRS